MERTEVIEEVIDLGKASVETKGEALIDQDVGGGRQQFLTGIAQD
ncbi:MULTISPECIES: benenodin family lasso peptide [Sphingomonadaceae]|uniref:Benenodin family lasso peptide n=1 Tax=Novosphingobium clariflavum TaxID=2029884 RepID=A0ABV6SEL5_9SPHN|nr:MULTISPECIES: benenodin family lasso peptide [Sphingomonadaceae]MCM3417978.1 benenodin family lasso peptide [Sphingopyxis alaskensis]